MNNKGETEVEACLLVIGPQREALLQSVRGRSTLGILPLGSFEALELRDEYFDLPNDELTHQKCALRVRHQSRAGKETCLIAFKGASLAQGSHCAQRFELEGPWPGVILREIGEELQRRGLPCGDTKAQEGRPAGLLAQLGFRPIQQRSTRREVAELTCGLDLVAELALDVVRFPISGGLVLHREIEVEARGTSDVADVLAIAEELQAQFADGLMAWPWSKTALGRQLKALDEAGELARWMEGAELRGEGYSFLAQLLGEG